MFIFSLEICYAPLLRVANESDGCCSSLKEEKYTHVVYIFVVAVRVNFQEQRSYKARSNQPFISI
jgi:hypothetical protein